jgi:hypothetical protein
LNAICSSEIEGKRSKIKERKATKRKEKKRKEKKERLIDPLYWIRKM